MARKRVEKHLEEMVDKSVHKRVTVTFSTPDAEQLVKFYAEEVIICDMHIYIYTHTVTSA